MIIAACTDTWLEIADDSCEISVRANRKDKWHVIRIAILNTVQFGHALFAIGLVSFWKEKDTFKCCKRFDCLQPLFVSKGTFNTHRELAKWFYHTRHIVFRITYIYISLIRTSNVSKLLSKYLFVVIMRQMYCISLERS